MRTRGWVAALVTIVAVGNWFLLREEPAQPTLPRPPEASVPPHAAASRIGPIAPRVTAKAVEGAPAPPPLPPGALEWEQARLRFARANALASEIQSVLRAPTAAHLFHAGFAVNECHIGPRYRAAAAPHTHLAKLVERCRDVPPPSAFEQKARAAPLSEESRDLLDAVEGKGRYRDAPFTERFAKVGPTGDPRAIGRVVSAWSTSEHSTLDGRSIEGDDAPWWIAAAELVACRSTNSCETSSIALALCAEQHVCTGSHVANMARLLGPDAFERVQRYMARIEEALRSGDYSGFR